MKKEKNRNEITVPRDKRNEAEAERERESKEDILRAAITTSTVRPQYTNDHFFSGFSREYIKKKEEPAS